MSVTVYSQPGCGPCSATKKYLTLRGIPFTEVDLIEDPWEVDTVRSLGYTEAPVVVAGEEHWSGFRPERLAALAADAA